MLEKIYANNKLFYVFIFACITVIAGFGIVIYIALSRKAGEQVNGVSTTTAPGDIVFEASDFKYGTFHDLKIKYGTPLVEERWEEAKKVRLVFAKGNYIAQTFYPFDSDKVTGVDIILNGESCTDNEYIAKERIKGIVVQTGLRYDVSPDWTMATDPNTKIKYQEVNDYSGWKIIAVSCNPKGNVVVSFVVK